MNNVTILFALNFVIFVFVVDFPHFAQIYMAVVAFATHTIQKSHSQNENNQMNARNLQFQMSLTIDNKNFGFEATTSFIVSFTLLKETTKEKKISG